MPSHIRTNWPMNLLLITVRGHGHSWSANKGQWCRANAPCVWACVR